MNRLELLLEEKKEIENAEGCLSSCLKYLNITRDHEYYNSVEAMKKQLELHIKNLDEKIKKTKESYEGLVITNESNGFMLSAIREDGKQVYLRLTFIRERFKSNNWNDSLFLDWVSEEENINECFIQYENFSMGENKFTKNILTKVYSHHKKTKGLESNIKPNTLKFREVSQEIRKNYHFKDN